MLEEMPPFPEQRSSSMLLKLKKRQGGIDQGPGAGRTLPPLQHKGANEGVTNEALASPSWRDKPEVDKVRTGW